MFSALKKVFSPEELGVRRSQQLDGVGAETLLRTLSPILKDRKTELLNKLFAAPPQLEELLDLRAQLKEVSRIEAELTLLRERGREASEALAEIFSPRP